MNKFINIKGAKTHNLKNINISIPKYKFCVITGLSGSGKSSLAFDTIYAAGQRKYVESLSAYARQFLQLMDKPDVDYIDGLSPAISVEQKSTSHNPRSTVGTTTEIYDYLRLLYARIGEAKCPDHNITLKPKTIKQIIDEILKTKLSKKIMILSPVVRNQKGSFKNLFDKFLKEGFIRGRIDKEITELSSAPILSPQKKHNIDIIIDRLRVTDSEETLSRLSDSIELATSLTNGLVCITEFNEDNSDVIYSTTYACPLCDYSIPPLEPNNFSFNNPNGACSTCAGLGIQEIIEPNSVINDESLSLAQGAIKGWGIDSSYSFSIIEALAKHYNFSINTPFKDLSDDIKNLIFYGTKGEKIKIFMTYNSSITSKETPFEGIIPRLKRRYTEATTIQKDEYKKYLTTVTCPCCQGDRLNKPYRNVFINNISLPKLVSLTIADNLKFFNELPKYLTPVENQIAEKIVKEIKERLQFLVNVGLDYLNLNRMSETLSGGESQRIRLASQIGSGLTGVMYVLDEPSIGLHQSDNDKLLDTLNKLKDLGNTLIVVEHDEDTIRQADHIIDIGPGAGIYGGEIVAQGNYEDIINNQNSITGMYLSHKLTIPIPKNRKSSNKFIKLKGAKLNNLKNISVSIPCGIFTCVTGVSGSGKSTLVNETIYPLIANKNKTLSLKNLKICDSIEGLEYIDKVINIDQSPIGRTPRSNPATYIDLFTSIRELFSKTNEARAKGYNVSRFSFNVKGGRCEACQGEGLIKIEMNFLPTVYITCDECKGKRYNQETLKITYKNKNISEVLDMDVKTALDFFSAIPNIKKKLETLCEVGLSYIKLGQSATTFSGGEAQRIKLAKELSKKDTGNTFYILDEPTTGLHFHDVNQLLTVLLKLRDKGNTILVIEHNLDVIKTADYIIDLGPKGGVNGGEVVAIGTPEDVAKCLDSYTGKYLKKYLSDGKI
ncbi:MAG: excinuclease ABC subunit UvrA [Succinivibrionaceae bacterium]